MPQEAFVYSVVTAVIGLLVVFVFLALLSFLMYAIKSIFGEKPLHEIESASSQRLSAEKAAGEEKKAFPGKGTENWLIAAVTVFLMEEAMEARRSAASWKPSAEEKSDPWVTFPRI